MKKLNKAGPSTDPWGTPLFTSLQLDSAPLTTIGRTLDCTMKDPDYFFEQQTPGLTIRQIMIVQEQATLTGSDKRLVPSKFSVFNLYKWEYFKEII